MDIIRIGKAIADARKAAGMTQEQLANQINVSSQAVSKWENGRKLQQRENVGIH